MTTRGEKRAYRPTAEGQTMKTLTAIAAVAGAIAFASGAPALAQAHGDHGHHPAPAQAGAPEAGHAHAHADFESGRFHVRVDGPGHPVGDVIMIPGLSGTMPQVPSPPRWPRSWPVISPNRG